MIAKQLTCPVCDRSQIEENICPNCETDLSVVRILVELPKERRISPWLFFLILVIMTGVGMGIGWITMRSFFSF